MNFIISIFIFTFLTFPIISSPYKVEGKFIAERGKKMSTKRACGRLVSLFKKKFQKSCPGNLVGEENTITTKLDFILCRCLHKNCMLRYTANCKDKREEILGTSITITRNLRLNYPIQ